jgi:phage terminase large subunit-like protein
VKLFGTLKEYEGFMSELAKRDNNTQLALMRELGKQDLFFLSRYILDRPDQHCQWYLDRCREIQAAPDWHIDLWARAHGKSSVITTALTIFDLINDPELTFCIFSNTRATAKKFLRQIMNIMSTNVLLKALYNDVLWDDPEKEAPKWSENDGIILKRKSTCKEASIEAWGCTDGCGNVGSHYKVLVFDDVCTEESVTSAEMKTKTLEGMRLAFNLVHRFYKIRFIGTRYAYDDAYHYLLQNKKFIPRIHPATDNGKIDGKAVFLTQAELEDKRKELDNDWIFSCQLLLNPLALDNISFNMDWIKYYDVIPNDRMNKYIIVDPANSKKASADSTSMWVVGFGADGHIYVLDGVKDKLNLTERAEKLHALYVKWMPNVVGYEQYGLQADIPYIKEREQRDWHTSMPIQPLGGRLKKEDRIKTLIPKFQNGEILLPRTLPYINYEHKSICVINEFLKEYCNFPNISHDDAIDCLARITDPALCCMFPTPDNEQNEYEREFEFEYADGE